MKPAGWIVVGALLGGAWAAPEAGAQPSPDGGPRSVPPPPPPLAAEAIVPPAPTPVAAVVAVAPETDRALRDPFWPPGYTPGATNTAEVLTDKAATNQAPRVPAVDALALARSLIRVQGFVRRDTQSYVMINGRMTGVGDIIRIQTQGATWRFVVRRIAGHDVTIEPLP